MHTVAPRVGAWIETLVIDNKLRYYDDVAPRVGAWIETAHTRGDLIDYVSHPVWVRGLKLFIQINPSPLEMSHPVWVRGLKQDAIYDAQQVNVVAPRVGAWIETRSH